MLLHVPEVLDADRLQRLRALLRGAEWVDGRVTAGTQSARAKNNQQLPEDSTRARAAGAIVLDGAEDERALLPAALPEEDRPPRSTATPARPTRSAATSTTRCARCAPPARTSAPTSRSRCSCAIPMTTTVANWSFEDTFGAQVGQAAAGDLILYPASQRPPRRAGHPRRARSPRSSGSRAWSAMSRQRRMLFDMDMAILGLRRDLGDAPAVVQLTSCYHNLLRMWADL
jgi:PKHD-type hydroxylase